MVRLQYDRKYYESNTSLSIILAKCAIAAFSKLRKKRDTIAMEEYGL